MLFPQLPGFILSSQPQHDKGSAPADQRFPSSTPIRPQLRPMPTPQRTAAILVAAGRGLRAGSGGPKQYRSIGGPTLALPPLEPFFPPPPIFALPPVLCPPPPPPTTHP